MTLARGGALRTLNVLRHRGASGVFETWADPRTEIDLYPSEWIGYLGYEVVA